MAHLDLDSTGWFCILEPHISPPPADDILVVSLSPKLDAALPPRRTKAFLKQAFCRTSHKPRLWNNNKSIPYAHFIKHGIIELMGGGGCPLWSAEMQPHISGSGRTYWKTGGVFALLPNVRVNAAFIGLHGFIRCHQNFCRRHNQRFNSAVFIVMRD